MKGARELLEQKGRKDELEALNREFASAMDRGDVNVAEAKRDALAELTQQVWMQTIDYWMGLLQFLYGRFQELNLLALAGPRFRARGQCGQRERHPGPRGRLHGADQPPPARGAGSWTCRASRIVSHVQ